MQVDSVFFDKLFEPSRVKVEKQLGTRVSQAAFSDMIFNSGIKFDIKLNLKKPFNGKKNKKKGIISVVM